MKVYLNNKFIDEEKATINIKDRGLLLGDSILSTEDGEKIHATIKNIADSCNVIKKDWNGFNILSPYASRAGGLEIGFIPNKNGINGYENKILKQKYQEQK